MYSESFYPTNIDFKQRIFDLKPSIAPVFGSNFVQSGDLSVRFNAFKIFVLRLGSNHRPSD
jgi:hypothetical protein